MQKAAVSGSDRRLAALAFYAMDFSAEKEKNTGIMHRVFSVVSHGRSETKWKGLDKYKNRRLIFYQLCILYYMIKELV